MGHTKRHCPLCAEDIAANALACKHCGYVSPAGRRTIQKAKLQSGVPMNGPPKKRPNAMGMAVLSILLCFPLGIVSIIFASLANGRYQAGDYAAAQNHCDTARTIALLGCAVGLIIGLLYAAASSSP